MMNIEELKADIIKEEGVKLNDNGEHILYNDHLGFKTFGIGHLCRATDPENDLDIGTPVSEERVEQPQIQENVLESFTNSRNVSIKDLFKSDYVQKNF